MPPKIRELIRDLESAGFQRTRGKGSHRKYRHSSGLSISISGSTGGDAKHYQIRDVAHTIKQALDEEA